MQCSCGGVTKDRVAVNSKAKQRLEYVECSSCQRCGAFRLFIRGQQVATGESAKAGYAGC